MSLLGSDLPISTDGFVTFAVGIIGMEVKVIKAHTEIFSSQRCFETHV